MARRLHTSFLMCPSYFIYENEHQQTYKIIEYFYMGKLSKGAFISSRTVYSYYSIYIYLLETWKRQFATLLVISADRGSSARFFGDLGTHDLAMDAPCRLLVAIIESIMHSWFRNCTDYTCMFTKLGNGSLLARARGPRLHGSKQNFV